MYNTDFSRFLLRYQVKLKSSYKLLQKCGYTIQMAVKIFKY